MVRVWISYFLLAFNLGTMNTLRGSAMFELFPAMASLASFAFLVMTFAVNRWFFAAVLVMFASGLLMAANLLHSYLIFGLAWWLVLEGIGLRSMRDKNPRSGLPVCCPDACRQPSEQAVSPDQSFRWRAGSVSNRSSLRQPERRHAADTDSPGRWERFSR